MDKATLDTPFSQLKFLSSHNTLITHAQMCGTIELSTAKEYIAELPNTPVCIELDISEYSMKQIPDTIFIDHNSNRFKYIDTPSKIRERYSMYTDFDETYHPELALNYSLDNVFEKIRVMVEEANSESIHKQLFPLLISIDISKIKKFKTSLKNTILEDIQTKFYSHFKGLVLPPSMRQGSLNITPLSELFNKVIIRIDSNWGDVSKPKSATQQLEFKIDKSGEIIPKGRIANSGVTTYFTRVYPPLFGAMPKTLKKALFGALSFGSKKIKSRKRGSVVRYSAVNQRAGASTVARSLKRIQNSIKPISKKTLNISPEKQAVLLSSSVKNNAASVKSYLRLDCEEPISYKWISNFIVNYYILSPDTALANVNSVAINYHDLDIETKKRLFGYFKFLYSDVFFNKETSVNHPHFKNTTLPTTSQPQSFSEWSATLNAIQYNAEASGKFGRRKRKSRKKTGRK